jgi:hyperosmotically inducible protein
MQAMRGKIGLCLFACSLFFSSSMQAQNSRNQTAERSCLVQEVRYQLMMLRNYSIFDNLECEVSGIDTVTIQGQVVRPSLKSDAERVIRALEGVRMLVNKIEVLPIDPDDEKMRTAVYHAILTQQDLQRYFIRAVPPIHIIVKNGFVTLVGSVGTQMDKNLAETAARDVPGTFGVSNKLKVEKE